MKALFIMVTLGLVLTGVLPARASAQEAPMVVVKEGLWKPFYPPTPEEKEIPIPAYRLDQMPVTNQQFLEFVKKNPKWRRGSVPGVFADKGYLAAWASPVSLGKEADARQAVTSVSWYAAKAFCEARGARLPTEAEWEYAAQASETSADGTRDSAWRQKVLDWYTRPASPKLPKVGAGSPNFFGIHDLHGLVWEWVADFNNNLIVSDSREAGDGEKNRFCGAGSQAASEKEDYASFMRLAYRSSLKATYTTSHLGFRCAADASTKGKNQ